VGVPLVPSEIEMQARFVDCGDRGFTSRPINLTDVEGITDFTTQDFANVSGARVVQGEWPVDLGGLEQDDIHWRWSVEVVCASSFTAGLPFPFPAIRGEMVRLDGIEPTTRQDA
tara:strand:- start:469 stop:810 length:342 start_codon:yes stop_codon:yes gene_type:complete